jgi:hypothetical protein
MFSIILIWEQFTHISWRIMFCSFSLSSKAIGKDIHASIRSMIQGDDELTVTAVDQFAGVDRVFVPGFTRVSEILAFRSLHAAIMKGPVKEIKFLERLRPEVWDNLGTSCDFVSPMILKGESAIWKQNLSNVTTFYFLLPCVPAPLVDACMAGGSLRVLNILLPGEVSAQSFASRCARQCPHLQCFIVEERVVENFNHGSRLESGRNGCW